MLFDLTASTNSRKLMILDPNYPKDVTTTVIKGNTVDATFTAKISEHGKPTEYTYQWYVNDIAIVGATEENFTLTGIGETVTSTVYCDVTNKKGTVRSRVATLKVTQYYTPVLDSNYPQDVSVEIHKSVTVTAAIATAGYPNSYTYQWYNNGAAVSGATGYTYTFTPTKVGNTSVYCSITNDAGTVSSRTATITANPVYLYNWGNTCDAITGGWHLRYSGYDGVTFTTNNGNGFMVMERHRESEGQASTGWYIDLSKYKTLKVAAMRTCGGDVYFGVMPDPNVIAYYAAVSIPQTSNYAVYSVDISNISGGYVGFYTAAVAQKGYIGSYSVWLE